MGEVQASPADRPPQVHQAARAPQPTRGGRIRAHPAGRLAVPTVRARRSRGAERSCPRTDLTIGGLSGRRASPAGWDSERSPSTFPSSVRAGRSSTSSVWARSRSSPASDSSSSTPSTNPVRSSGPQPGSRSSSSTLRCAFVRFRTARLLVDGVSVPAERCHFELEGAPGPRRFSEIAPDRPLVHRRPTNRYDLEIAPLARGRHEVRLDSRASPSHRSFGSRSSIQSTRRAIREQRRRLFRSSEPLSDQLAPP